MAIYICASFSTTLQYKLFDKEMETIQETTDKVNSYNTDDMSPLII
jgi:hypothetical protein